MSKRKDHKGKLLQPGEYQRKNGTYEYRWTNQFGERCSVYAKTLAELRDLEAEILVKSQQTHCPSTLTFGELFRRWMATKVSLTNSTRLLYEQRYNTHVLHGDFPLANMKLADINKATMRRFYNSVYERHALGVKAFDTLHSILRQTFEFAVDDDIIDRNPAIGAEKEALAKTKKDALGKERIVKAMSLDEQNRLFRYMEEHDRVGYYPLFRLMMLTGMRVGEALALQWTDVDFMRAELRVSHTLCAKGGELHVTSTKSHKNRRLPLCPEAIALLQKRKYIDDELGLKVSTPIDGYDDFIFVSRSKRPFDQDAANMWLKRLVKLYNKTATQPLPPITTHWFRHTFATRMFEANVAPKTVQELLGHANCNITMNIYTSVMDDVKRDAMAQFADHIASSERTKLTTFLD